MQEKRKNIRVSHESGVVIHAEGGTFPGRLVDMSRNGMQVVAYLPVDHDKVQSVSFSVPHHAGPLDIPCRVARLKTDGGGAVLGLQFSFHAEAQLLLVEQFIREHSAESRLVPRAACDIREVECPSADGESGLAVESIADLSTEGLLLYFRGTLEAGDPLELRFRLPGDSRPLKTAGRVSYIVHNEFRGVSAAGLSFEGIGTIEQTRIHNFILASSSGSQASALFSRLDSGCLDLEFRIVERPAVLALFRGLLRRGSMMNLLKENSYNILELPLAGLQARRGRFSFNSNDGFDPGETVKCSFHLRGGTYYFSSNFIEAENGLLQFKLPDQVTRCEKRGYGRKIIGKTIMVFAGAEGATGAPGTLVDISRRGFLCELGWSAELESLIRPGSRIGYSVDETLGLFSYGLVRHAVRQGASLRFGVESGLHGSGRLRRTRYSPERWNSIRLYPGKPSGSADAGDSQAASARVVRFHDLEGRQLTALVNAGAWNEKADVVIIPPAFGKKKEALAGLAATFVATWKKYGRNVAVLRYDGVNRPGESSNEEMHPKRGYEMLRYRLSRGRLDLEAALAWAHSNDLFQAERIVLAAFSMSALDVRKILLKPDGGGVDVWISVMGVPAAQGALCNTLGGIDIISNRRMGMTNGVCGLLGHLVDMDNLADDAVEQKYAFLTDARLDMARVAVPVVWIHGTHDRWIDPAEVRDIMSVQAPAARELIEVPTGHALRASEDALKVFRLIAASAWRRLHGSSIRPVVPTRQELAGMVTAERERLEQREKLEKESYWREYMIGKDPAGAGYDFFARLHDFSAFLDRQLDLLDLQPDLVIADMGCGTGLLLERLLGRCVRLGSATVSAVDLVPEALDKAAAKAAGALGIEAGTKGRRPLSNQGVRVSFVQRNLEPGRLEPLCRFIARPGEQLVFLRGRLEGLSSAALDRLSGLPADQLDSALREKGQPGQAALTGLLDRLEPADQALLGELRAAALLAGNPALDGVERFKLLHLGDSGRGGSGFPAHSFDRIAASLFISYIFNPDYLVEDFFRLLRPGGLVLISSMRPDSDISVIFTDFIRELGQGGDADLQDARSMLNEAAGLFELEEEGFFRFFTAGELEELLRSAGFKDIRSEPVLGNPTQAFVVTGRKP